MPHVDEAASGFPHHGESFDQKVVERRPLRDLLPEFDGLGGEVDIGQLAYGRLQVVDSNDDGLHAFNFALGLGAEELREYGIDNHELVSLRWEVRSSHFTLLKMTVARKLH